MELIAKTKDGILIHATEAEVNEILNAVNGKKPDKLEIGQKIPAIDYASTITKVKSLGSSYEFRQVLEYTEKLNGKVQELKNTMDAASKIEI